MHHECQDSVYQEMQSYGIKDSYILEDIENLPYLKASIAEAMRLKTVVPCGIPHGNGNQQTHLAGYTIPKNTMVCAYIELF